MNKRIEQKNPQRRPLGDISSSACLNILRNPDSTQSGKSEIPSGSYKEFNLFVSKRKSSPSVEGTTKRSSSIQSDKKEQPLPNKLRRGDAGNPETEVRYNLGQLKDLPPFAKEEIKQQIKSIHEKYEKSRETIINQYEEALEELNSSGKSSSDKSKEAQKLAVERDSKLENAREEWINKFQGLNKYVLAGTQNVVSGLVDKIAVRLTGDRVDGIVEKAEQETKRLKDKYSASRTELKESDERAWKIYKELVPGLTEMVRITTLLGKEVAGSDRPLRDDASSHSVSPRGDLGGPIDRGDDGGHEMAHRKIVFDLYAQTLSSARTSRLTQKQAERAGQEAYEKSRRIRETDDFRQTLKNLNDHELSPEEREASVKTFIEKHLQYHPRLSSVDALAPEPPIIDKCQALVELARKRSGEHTTQQETIDPEARNRPYSEEERQARETALNELVKDFSHYNQQFASESHIHATAARNFSAQVAAALERLDALANDSMQKPDQQREIAQARQGMYNALAAIRYLSPEVGAQIHANNTNNTNFSIEESSPSAHHQTIYQRFKQAFKEMQEGRKEAPIAQLDLSPIEEHLKLNDPVSLASLPHVTKAALAKLTQLGEINEGSAQNEENIQEYRRLVARIEEKYAPQLQAHKDAYESAYKQAERAPSTAATSRERPGGTWSLNRKDYANRPNEKTPVAEGPMTDGERRIAEAKEKWEQTLAQREVEIATLDHFYKPMTLGRVRTEAKALAAQLEAALLERDAVLTKMGDIQADIERNNAYKKKYTIDPASQIADLEQKQMEQSAKLMAVKAKLATAIQAKSEIAGERNHNIEETEQAWKDLDRLTKELDIKRRQGEAKITKAERNVDRWRNEIEKERTGLKEREEKYEHIQDRDERTRRALADTISHFEQEIKKKQEKIIELKENIGKIEIGEGAGSKNAQESEGLADKHKGWQEDLEAARRDINLFEATLKKCQEYQGSLERLDKVTRDHQASMSAFEEKHNFSQQMLDKHVQNLHILENKYLNAMNDVFKVEGDKNAIQAQADVIDKAFKMAKDYDKEIDVLYERFQADARGIVKTEHSRYLHFLGMRDRTRQLALIAFAISLGGGMNDILQQIAVSGYMPLMGMLVR